MASLIRSIQNRAHDRFLRIPELAGVPVLARKPKQTLSDLAAALAQLELGIFVWPPLLKKIRPNSTGLFAEEIEIRVSVFENPTLNARDLEAYDLVEIGLFYFHHYDLKIPGVDIVYAQEIPAIDASTDALVMFDLLFVTSGGFEARPAHV